MAHNHVLHSLIHAISEFSKSSSLHPQNPSKPFILTCCCGGHRQSYRSRSHFDCLFLKSNPVANFNLPAPCILFPKSWLASLKIAASLISTLSSRKTWGGGRGGSQADDTRQRSCTGFERAIPRARVPAELQRCVSTVLGADLVRDHHWWMSWDGVWPNTAASIFTQAGRQTGRQTAWHKEQTDRHFSFCFILIHLKLFRCWLSRCSLLLCCYLPLKVKHSPIVLWELISCWCSRCYCCCCRESWYSACAVVLISLHQRSAWIIMASDCKATPRASLHIIMRWRYDWCQMNSRIFRMTLIFRGV